MQAVHPLFGDGEEDEVRDNACGAISRLLTSPLADQLPLDQVRLLCESDVIHCLHFPTVTALASQTAAHQLAPFCCLCLKDLITCLRKN